MPPLIGEHKILCLRWRTIPTISGTVKSVLVSGCISRNTEILTLIHAVTEIATFFRRAAVSKVLMKTLVTKAFVSSQNLKNGGFNRETPLKTHLFPACVCIPDFSFHAGENKGENTHSN